MPVDRQRLTFLVLRQAIDHVKRGTRVVRLGKAPDDRRFAVTMDAESFERLAGLLWTLGLLTDAENPTLWEPAPEVAQWMRENGVELPGLSYDLDEELEEAAHAGALTLLAEAPVGVGHEAGRDSAAEE